MERAFIDFALLFTLGAGIPAHTKQARPRCKSKYPFEN
jgi:hypothetical protein